ncbi:MAG TPA: PIG-L deacetylase family protein [Terriglobales bacterium]|nr:PIG-L deacetylase family protein [Terriglobales bacterium]
MTKRLLCITAHPDDEAGNFGGTLAIYGRRGVETSVICLTAGAAARHRGAASSDGQLTALRREEFARSCRRLGVSHGEVLDYPDGKLASAQVLKVTSDLVLRIRRIRPDVVLTFGPEGGVTAHADHAMAGMFASLAFQWAGRDDRFPEQVQGGASPHRSRKLYYSTGLITLEGRQPVAQPPVTASIDISAVLDVKLAAFQEHTTQAPLYSIFQGAVRRHGGFEHWHLAATAEPQRAEFESDLFSGL